MGKAGGYGGRSDAPGVAELRVRVYPDFAIGENFLFPDGNGLLDGVDDVAAGVKGIGAVGGGHANQYSGFANLQRSFAVNDDIPDNGPVLVRFVGNLLHFRNGHAVVGFVFEPVNGAFLRIVAHHAQKEVDSTGPVGLQVMQGGWYVDG